MKNITKRANHRQEALLAALAISLMSLRAFLSTISGAILPLGMDHVAGKWALSLGREPQAQR